MNNIKVVHIKKTMTSNIFTEAVPQSNPMERCPKSTQHTRRKTPMLACKSSESQEAIILKSKVCMGALSKIHPIPLEKPPQ